MFSRFCMHIKKYWRYAFYSSRSSLKSEVANSYLNWLWWILDPLCFMMIYAFIFGYVFNASEPYFPVFIFIGITMWDFFNKSMVQSVKLVRQNKAIVSKVYLPKYVLLMVKMGINGFKMLVSIGIIICMLVVWQVPVTWRVVYALPILLTLVVLTFGFGCFLMHYGVFIEDLSNVLNIALRLMFYMTGIFWNIMTRLPAPYNKYIAKCNPIAFLLSSMRDCVLYGKSPNLKWLLLWFVIGVVISILGIRKIYKYENSYVKVI